MMQHRHSSATFPNWAPAFAGVVASVGQRGCEFQLTVIPCSLFSREGGSPDWVPAFEGKQAEGRPGWAASC